MVADSDQRWKWEHTFCGVITSLNLAEEEHLRYIGIHGLTESWLLARNRYSQAFQNPHMRYGTLIKYLSDKKKLFGLAGKNQELGDWVI